MKEDLHCLGPEQLERIAEMGKALGKQVLGGRSVFNVFALKYPLNIHWSCRAVAWILLRFKSKVQAGDRCLEVISE